MEVEIATGDYHQHEHNHNLNHAEHNGWLDCDAFVKGFANMTVQPGDPRSAPRQQPANHDGFAAPARPRVTLVPKSNLRNRAANFSSFASNFEHAYSDPASQHSRFGPAAAYDPARNFNQGAAQAGLLGSQWASARFATAPGRMADVDSRPDQRHYGGGGGGRGYGNRKRRRGDDDDFDRRPQRRRYEEPMSARVRRQLLAIAESPLRDPMEETTGIARQIGDNVGDDTFCNMTIDFMQQLVIEQPFKGPFVAAVLHSVNDEKPGFMPLVLTQLQSRLQDHLDKGEWRPVKLLLRFLACLQRLFLDDNLFALLEELFNRAADLQAVSPDDALGLELVKIIMMTIPFIVVSTGSKYHEKVNELLAKTDIIASAPREVENLFNPYIASEDPNSPYPQSALALFQRQLMNEAEAGWPLAFMPRILNVEDAPLIDASKCHAFPEISVPQTIPPGPHPLFPQLYFSLYADQDVETVPPTSSLASTILRDTLVDIINSLDFNRSAAGKLLIDMDCYWAPNIFVKRATPFDKLKELPEGSPTWKAEDLAVDAIFSQLLLLPSPEHKQVYFHAMITETCKIAPAAIAPSLGRAIRFLYRNVEFMDVELGYRFVDWFAHHLSNFDFRWKWTEWVEDVDRSRLHPKKAFILGALDKEIRLSFAKRIRDGLPEPYAPLVPPAKDLESPEFKFNDETTPYSSEAKQIVTFLRKKATEGEIDEVMNTIRAAEEERDPSVDPLLACADVFVTCLCHVGAKSLSHVLSYIERCKDRLGSFATVRGQTISSVVNFWKDVQPGVAVNIVDKLLNYTIVSPASVLEWAFAPQQLNGGRILAETWVYEMVSQTMGKVSGRVRQIVAARAQRGLPQAQADVLDRALAGEMQAMRNLFAIIDDGVKGVAEGSDDVMLEQEDGAGGKIGETTLDEGDADILRSWGMKWRRVFSRKLAVEESVNAEAAKRFPPAAEVEAEMPAANGNTNGFDDDLMVTDGVGGANGSDEIL